MSFPTWRWMREIGMTKRTLTPLPVHPLLVVHTPLALHCPPHLVIQAPPLHQVNNIVLTNNNIKCTKSMFDILFLCTYNSIIHVHKNCTTSNIYMYNNNLHFAIFDNLSLCIVFYDTHNCTVSRVYNKREESMELPYM